MQTLLRTAVLAALTLVVLPIAHSQAAEIKMLAGGGMAPVLKELVPQFERATGHRVTIAYSAAPASIKQIASGEPFDLVVSTHEVVMNASVKPHLAGKPVDIARVGIGAVVRAGAPKLDIGSADGLKQALTKAKSVTFVVESASGAHILKVFERLGVADAMKGKTIPQKDPNQVAPTVAKGEAELGLSITNTLIAPGVDFVGAFPSDLNLYLTFAAVTAAKAPQAAAAAALIKHLTAPAAVATIKARGMEPAF